MEIREILSRVDHTLLAPDADQEQVKALCAEAVICGTASVCIAPAFVKAAAEYCGGRVKVCTVVGFPTGYSTTAAKCFEAAEAVRNGADEVDMVINIGWLKDKKYDDILNEINAVKAACGGRLLKVIIETCLLSGEEKVRMCDIVSRSDAEYIKTSTGFSKAGATTADVELMAKHITNGKLIKAAGGIATLADAEKFISLGAARLGTSRIVKIAKENGYV